MARRSTAAADPVSAPIRDFPSLQYRDIDLVYLVESPLNQRHIDEVELRDLAANIEARGVVEPLIVREAELAFGSFEIAAGVRRARAARLANLVRVPCVIRPMTDVEFVEVSLTENNQRKQPHELEEAEGIAKLQELDRARTDEVIAKTLGRPVSFVRGRKKLLNLVEPAREAFRRHVILVTHAEIIAGLPADQQPAAFAECFNSLVDPDLNHEDADYGASTLEKAIEGKKWDVLKRNLRGTRSLQGWVDEFGKRDVRAPEVQQQLQEALADDDTVVDAVEQGATLAEAVAAATGNILQLSELGGWQLDRDQAKAAGVLRSDAYRVVKSSSGRCDWTVPALFVHPPKTKRGAVEVCTNTRCKKHWPPAKKQTRVASGTSAGARTEKQKTNDAKAAEKAAADAKFAAEVYAPAVKAAVLKASKGLKFDADFLDWYGRHSTGDGWYADSAKNVERWYGVKLTDATAAQVFFLHDIGDIDDGVWGLDDAAELLDLDLKKLEKQLRAEFDKKATTTAPAKPKAAKKKGGR